MKIKVIGQNSSNRRKLLKNTNKVIEELRENIEIELVEDSKYFSQYNISNTPALAINGKVVSQGKVLNDREIKNFIKILS